MKLCRYGKPGYEKPGMIDGEGKLRGVIGRDFVISSELMVRLFLILGLLALTTVAAAAQSWGAYSRIGLQRHRNYKEPCWSAASSKCAREQSRKVLARRNDRRFDYSPGTPLPQIKSTLR